MSGERDATVLVRRLASAHDLPLPERATPSSAGYDLRACVDDEISIAPGARAAVPTGIAIALPQGYEGQVRPRSGLARRHGIALVNAPGTIDADYRGEIQVLLVNLGSEPVGIERGERIAQLVVQRLPAIELREAPEVPSTERGAGGFGHTGRR